MQREFNLSDETTSNLEFLIDKRFTAIENNCLVDRHRVNTTEIYLGTLLYLHPTIELELIEHFLKRIYSRNEVEQLMIAIKRYPEWLQRKDVTIKDGYDSHALKISGD